MNVEQVFGLYVVIVGGSLLIALGCFSIAGAIHREGELLRRAIRLHAWAVVHNNCILPREGELDGN